METVNVPNLLTRLKKTGVEIDIKEASFFVGQENIVPVEGFKMNYWRATIFACMARNAMPITAFFKIPHDRVIALGVYVEL